MLCYYTTIRRCHPYYDGTEGFTLYVQNTISTVSFSPVPVLPYRTKQSDFAGTCHTEKPNVLLITDLLYRRKRQRGQLKVETSKHLGDVGAVGMFIYTIVSVSKNWGQL